MARYTLTQMRTKHKAAGLHFFDRDVMKMFGPAKYKTRYDAKTDTNYIRVEGRRIKDGLSWYTFNPKTGEIDYIAPSRVPMRVREK